MATFIWLGTAAGFFTGLVHAFHLVREHHVAGPYGLAAVIYRAIWAVLLWSLFGAYLLAFWILGSVLMLLSGRSTAQTRQAILGSAT